MLGSSLSKVEKLVRKGKANELIRLTDDKDSALRLKAIEGLGKVGGFAGLNALITLLRDTDPAIRIAAAKALEEQGDVKSRTHVEYQLKNEQDEKVKEALRSALAKIKKENPLFKTLDT